MQMETGVENPSGVVKVPCVTRSRRVQTWRALVSSVAGSRTTNSSPNFPGISARRSRALSMMLSALTVWRDLSCSLRALIMPMRINDTGLA